ncbi:MAG: sensor histidine kinase [Zoogloeaceae bacterium]|nr:sensor histidine kinase [Zoogloeaceae bacterium]
MRLAWRPVSLRGRLIGLLVVPLLVVLAVSVVVDYRTAVSLTDATFDRALLGTAMALASRLESDDDDGPLELDLPPAAEAILRADEADSVLYAVIDGAGRRIAGDEALAALAPSRMPGAPAYRDAQLGGRSLRVVEVAQESRLVKATILVAETTHKREQATARILQTVIGSNLLLIATALGLLYFGVRLGLRPLDELGRQIDQRGAEDFRPVPTAAIPAEARPLAAALNRLLTRLEAAGQAQQSFLSAAAHQLRTPLAGLQTQLDLANQDLPAEVRPRLTRLRDSVARLNHFVRQMLALARSSPEAAAAMSFQTMDLSDLLEDCASDFLDGALARGLELAFEPAPAPVAGAQWLLREMLANLVDNAIAHGPPGSLVVIRCGTDDTEAWIEVEDAGPGIPPAEAERLFEPFYRPPGSPPGGSGLGLAIVREVAERHQGRVAFQPGSHGRGTRVRVVFPSVTKGACQDSEG